MKGLIKYTTALCLGGGLAMSTGCNAYRDCVDPCWPERYQYEARQPVLHAFAAQAHNGHVLDQTVWNYQFEPGSDKLTPGGMDHLVYLARRRPCPDSKVYLQTAHDIAYNPDAPDQLVSA